MGCPHLYCLTICGLIPDSVPATYDEAGNITAEAWDETVEVEVPVMGMIYRDATPDEIEAMEHEEIPDMPQSPEDRIAELESALDTLLSGRTE